jgi:hypothetical protein
MTLRATGSAGASLKYRWVQVQGLPVEIDRPTSEAVQFEVPQGSGTLRFLLVVGNSKGVDSTTVTIPLQGVETDRPDGSADPPVADAGDDQVGLIGHLITLNGIRSEPRPRIAYRWMHLSGPPIDTWRQDGYTFSFIPETPGHYRFGLVVATAGSISEPDVVDVFVGTSAPSAAAMTTAPNPLAAPSPPGLGDDMLARQALLSIEGGPALAGSLATAFEELAQRMDLYTSYVELFSEMSRRLDLIVPADPSRRSAWIERLFTPLTARLVERMRAEGLDLVRQGGQASPMTAAQKKRLAELFNSIAQGFRAGSR